MPFNIAGLSHDGEHPHPLDTSAPPGGGHPKISLKTLQLSGLFDPGGEGRVRLRVGEASFTFRRLDGGFTSKRHGRPAQTIRLVSRSLKFGERTYFVCPLAGDPCLDLFDVDGVLASRDAHQLSHRSRADPKAYAQEHTPAAAKPRLRRRRARSAAPAPVGHWRQARDSTIRGLEGGRELVLSEQTLAETLPLCLPAPARTGRPILPPSCWTPIGGPANSRTSTAMR